MSDPENKEVQTMFASDVVVTNQTIHLWESVDYLAAKTRLNLARRYQDQYESLTIEFANLRASQSWLATQNGEEAACLLISHVEVLAPYFRQRGLCVELLRWCEDGLGACERLQQNPGRLLLLLGKTQHALGRWDEATTGFQTAIEISEGEDSRTHAQAVLALGHLQFNQGDYVIALETLTRAEKLLSELSDHERLATVRSERAAYYLNRGDFDKALSLYLEVDQLRKQAGEVLQMPMSNWDALH